MANGSDLDLDSIWADVPSDKMTIKDKAVKDSFFHISKSWENLPCDKHHGGIEWLKKCMYILIGMGIIITTLLIPILIEIAPQMFNRRVAAETNVEGNEDGE